MCGEQPNYPLAPNPVKGSPPRVRGTGLRPAQGRDPLRITPACAGNSPAFPFPFSHGPDHPRVCGEQVRRKKPYRDATGSPPRVRGTGLLILRAEGNAGITPACAGNSTARYPQRRIPQDHPRVCGEQIKFPWQYFREEGSPPRVRGTAFRFQFCRKRSRITPACAGNSSLAGMGGCGA